MSSILTATHRARRITLDATDGATAAWLHAHGEVLGTTQDGLAVTYRVRLSDADYERVSRREPGHQ